MREFIRAIRHPVLFDSRTLHVALISERSPVDLRKLAWRIRKHPDLYLRARHIELVLPGHAVVDFHGELEAAS
jgi:hypothetical protein